MSTASILLTADQLDQFPDDGKRREVIGGELYVSPSPVRIHQSLVKRVLGVLVREIDGSGSGEAFTGPVDVRFSPTDQVQPDLLAIGQDRLHLYEGHIVHGAPDIVVEILSPSTERYDLIEKRRLYERHGVPEYWIVDPYRRSLTILRLTDDVYTEVEPDEGMLRSTAIANFTVDPKTLFAGIPAA